jgi:uncharacterized protein (DUF427 family)
VWDYPRPPSLEPVSVLLQVSFGGVIIARTTNGHRVCETSHAPAYYFPPTDVRTDLLEAADGSSYCEWKGVAVYFHIVVGDERAERAAWAYPDPSPRFTAIADHLAFYARSVDACQVGDEIVTPMDGDFYGGWITSNLVGPIKGAPGTRHW